MKNNNKIAILISLVYLIVCLIISFNRIPFWDEARAWLIAQNCDFVALIDMMKLECHFAFWYLIIAPFAKLDIFYPYSIYIINSVFAFFAIFLMWRRAPFNIVQKILITFGVPFLFLWGSVARCYSIGIFFLFFALSIYKIRFKKPFCYLILLCLSMHTSVMAFIGGFFLVLIFLFENIKKKDFWKLFLIFLLGIFLVLIQIYSPNPDYLKQNPEMSFLRDFFGYLLNPILFIKGYEIQTILMSFLRCSILVMAVNFIIFTFKNNKKVLSFIVLTYFSIVILFSYFYSGNFWHYFYFYLYFIVAMWILKKENKITKVIDVVFCLILFFFLFKGSLFIDAKLTLVNDSKSFYIAQEIKNNYKDKKIFCLDAWSDIVPASVPYLKEIVIYDKNNLNRKLAKSLRNQINFNNEAFSVDEFIKYVDNNSILVSTGEFFIHEKNNPQLKYSDEKIAIFKSKSNQISFVLNTENKETKLRTYLIKVNK